MVGGARRHRAGVLIAAAALAVAVAGVVVLLVAGRSSHDAAAAMRSAARYGGYPSWLPNTTLPAPASDAPLISTASHRQLDAVEGDPIEARLPRGGEAEITAVGPALPAWVSAAAQAGRLTQSAVPTTFDVTVIATRGSVPLTATDFSILTAGGQLVRPAVTAAGAATTPRLLRAGQHVTLALRSRLVEGDGSLRWAPGRGQVMAGWLYQLELD